MLDLKELLAYNNNEVKKVLSIDCNNQCAVCKEKYKSGRWCPKAYADDFAQGLTLIIQSEGRINKIIKQMKEEKELNNE